MPASQSRTPVLTVLAIVAAAGWAGAQGHATSLAPYMMDEAREVALARSAAPPQAADKAGVHVLGPQGYRLVAPSENGFTCLVERSFTSPTTDPKEFYEPRTLAPICFTPDAAATLMQRDLFIAPLVAKGTPLPDIRKAESEAYASGVLRHPGTAVFAYMLSSAQWLGPGIANWHPHVMIWAPGVEVQDVLPKGLQSFGLASGLPVLDTRYGPNQTLIVIPVTTSVDPRMANAQDRRR